MVYEAALLMIDAVDPPWLEAYRLKVLFYHTEYGVKCWPLAPLSDGAPLAERTISMDPDEGK